jgi:hypothetical protein
MAIWSDLNSRLNVLLDDSGLDPSYPEIRRIEAWNRAQNHFALTHTSMLRIATAITSDYVDGKKALYPTDYLEMPQGGVQDGDFWLEPVALVPGERVSFSGYMLFPDGIYLPGFKKTSIKLWYFSRYAVVTAGTSNIEVPQWAIDPLLDLSMVFMLYPDMMNQASLRSFQARREAGDPEDNPPRRQAQFFLKLYQETVATVRPQDRSVLFRVG